MSGSSVIVRWLGINLLLNIPFVFWIPVPPGRRLILGAWFALGTAAAFLGTYFTFRKSGQVSRRVGPSPGSPFLSEVGAPAHPAPYETALQALLHEVLHEIKQPLTVVQGYIQLLERQVTDTAAQQDLQTARTQLQRVFDYIQEMRQHPTQAVHPPEWTDLGVLLERHLQAFRRLAAAQDVWVEFERPNLPPVYIRGEELEHVLWNLLINALEALKTVSTGDRRVEVRLTHFASLWDRDADTTTGRVPCGIALVVRDTGPGIPPDQRTRIFQPFYTTRPGTGHFGLGLTICRYLVEKNGGRIEARPVTPRGVEFRVWWPCGMAHHQRAM
ncbi:MAG: HAMP domain-containing histidine kinase [Acidobacteria bacterium]|nr:HAMP domain-containing histidine kinase [Acidobacteriota bacterium]MDW7984475.1 HAMP domain-containing sensor histidine kinase [Acidobacteriota bacterium]